MKLLPVWVANVEFGLSIKFKKLIIIQSGLTDPSVASDYTMLEGAFRPVICNKMLLEIKSIIQILSLAMCLNTYWKIST